MTTTETQFDSATSLALGSSVDGRIDPEDDKDVFRLDLSSQSSDTDVWIYATGDLDSFGELLSSTGAVIVSNDNSFIEGRWRAFHIRWDLSPDVYYVRVGGGPSENTDRRPTGDYTLHAQAVTEYPGGTTEMATLLDLDSIVPGMIEEKSDEDFFRLDVPEPMNLVIEAWTFDLYDGNEKGLPREDLDVEVLDRKGEVTPVNVRVYFLDSRLRTSLMRALTTSECQLPTTSSRTPCPMPSTLSKILAIPNSSKTAKPNLAP